MKKIVIDSFPISTPYVGLGEFCRQIGERLGKRAKELKEKYNIELYFIVPPQCKGCFGNDVHYMCVLPIFRKLLSLYPFKADLFHIPYQCSKIKSLAGARKHLLTVHDINFIYEKKGKGLQKDIKKFNRKIKKADYINFISQFAQKDTKKHFDIYKPFKIIYNGVTNLSDIARKENLPSGLPDNFLFHISSLQPKKNVHLLVEMMDYLPEHNLLIVGNWETNYAKDLMLRIKKSKYRNIYTLPSVTEAEKAALYEACNSLLFPSLCEGFGLPPIEVMKFGKPVFLSTLTSLPEVGGEVAFYWEKLEPKHMADVLRSKLDIFNASQSYPNLLKKNADRFDWDNCVDQYIKLYLEILK